MVKYGHAKQFDKRAVSIVNCYIWPFPNAALKASVHCSDILWLKGKSPVWSCDPMCDWLYT